jgi:magnesium-transporting ATPase (P-type)
MMHDRERPQGKTVLQSQLEKLALGLFFFAILLGVVVIGVNKLRCVHHSANDEALDVITWVMIWVLV